MAGVIEAYKSVTASDEFKELERLRDRAGHNEAAALRGTRCFYRCSNAHRKIFYTTF